MSDREASTTNASDDLSFIRQVIQDGRRAIVLDATPFIVWGAVVVLGTFLERVCKAMDLSFNTIWLWLGLIGIGWVYSIKTWMVRRKRLGAQTLADRALAAIWIGCWAAMTLVGFVGFFGKHLEGAGIAGSLAIIIGTGYFATAAVVNHGGVRILGVAWWLGGSLIYLWETPHFMLLFSAMIVLLQVVPGLLLQRRWKEGASSS